MIAQNILDGEGFDVVDIQLHAEDRENAHQMAGDRTVADNADLLAGKSLVGIGRLFPNASVMEAAAVSGNVAQGGQHVSKRTLGNGFGKESVAGNDANAALPQLLADKGNNGAAQMRQNTQIGGGIENGAVGAGRAPAGDVGVAVADALDDLLGGQMAIILIPNDMPQGFGKSDVFGGEKGRENGVFGER